MHSTKKENHDFKEIFLKRECFVLSQCHKDELKITIKEKIKDAMREFKKHVLGEIRSMQKSIEDLEVTVKEKKNEIKSLMDRTKALDIL